MWKCWSVKRLTSHLIPYVRRTSTLKLLSADLCFTIKNDYITWYGLDSWFQVITCLEPSEIRSAFQKAWPRYYPVLPWIFIFKGNIEGDMNATDCTWKAGLSTKPSMKFSKAAERFWPPVWDFWDCLGTAPPINNQIAQPLLKPNPLKVHRSSDFEFKRCIASGWGEVQPRLWLSSSSKQLYFLPLAPGAFQTKGLLLCRS